MFKERTMNGSQDRRSFLKTGIRGIAGTTLLSGSVLRGGNETSVENKLISRKLGKTGIRLPIISMGTGDTGDPGLVKAAMDAGVRLLATSQYYGDGQNERLLGQIIKERGRDAVIIMTSAMPDGFNHKAGKFDAEARADRFAKKLDGSLERLGVEAVDIFLLPFLATRESVFFEPYLKAMENIKKQGKARFIGIATHSLEHEAIRAAVETGVYDIAMSAYNFRRKNHREISDAMAVAAKAGMGIIAMKTMAGAYWDKERTRPINAKAALKWVLQNENVHTAVPGMTTYEQIKLNFSLMEDLSLTDQEKADLKLSMHPDSNGPYCQQCGTCIAQCRKNLDIPTLMRSHMYAFGYRNLVHARDTLSSVTKGENPCTDCDSCTVQCALNFDIKNKISDIARLNTVPESFLV